MELSKGNIPASSGSLLDALKNGHINDFDVYSSKDGFNQDANFIYTGYSPTVQWKQEPAGKNIADLNYIVRQSGSNYYLLAVNNSNTALSNIEFYLESGKVSGSTVTEIRRNSDGTTFSNSMSTTTKRRNGDYYKAFTEDSITPFEVKIYRIPATTSLIKQNTNNGNPEEHLDEKTTSFTLFSNYPNPFNPSTVISYNLPSNSSVKLKIFDVLGREIVELVNEEQSAGLQKITWNGLNKSGVTVSSGIYIYKVTATDLTTNATISKQSKMLLIK